MRPTKFRGFSLKQNAWIYGDLVHLNGETYILPDNSTSMVQTVPVDAESVGEWTGMQDTEGNDIYEGDIGVNEDMTPLKVMYAEPSFEMRKMNGYKVNSNIIWHFKFEVTSNTYENGK